MFLPMVWVAQSFTLYSTCMLDIDFIKQNKEAVEENARQKQVDVSIDDLLATYERWKQQLQEVETLRRQRNEIANELKDVQGKPPEEKIQQGREVKEKLATLEEPLSQQEQKYLEALAKVPNMKTDDTPVGTTEAENVVLRTVGEPRTYDFEPKEHQVLGEALDLIDTETATKVSGSRFAYLKRDLVQLQFALIQLGFDTLTSEEQLSNIANRAKLGVSAKPFVPMLPPVMMRTEPYDRTARLKAEDTTYKLAGDDLWLIGSAEHTMCPYYMDQTLDLKDMPLRFVGYSTSFRREAGNYGKDTHGIIRMHHFDKLEMESFTAPQNSRDEHEFMIAIQEHLMEQLELPYQVVLKCTADMGDPNARGVDIETWFPAQKTYRETHSADYMTDYQARRLNTKIAHEKGERIYAHTNDATVFAMGRTLAAIMENYQQADGHIAIPKVLQAYVNKEVIRAN